MCLSSERKEPFISTADITCYKILIPVGSRLITPYREFCFPIGEVVHDVALDDSRVLFDILMIESGYFHSYANIEVATREVSKLKRRTKAKLEIYEAIIPKGTEYFRGQFEDLCSKSLKIVKKVFD